MHKRRLGRTDIQISPLVFGCNVFGWTADRETSFALLDRFADAGLETLDTADVYSRWVPGHAGGESEVIIGAWMHSRGRRDKTIVITKVGFEIPSGDKGLSAAHIERAVEDSLRRLRTDYIDVYFSHVHDDAVPYEETLKAYEKLIAAGKVRAIGASQHDAPQLRAALDVAAAQHLPRYEVLQPGYNLYDRAAFDGPLCELALDEGIGVITYYSLAKGFLSGKYRSAADLGQSVRGTSVEGYLDPRGMRILQALDQVAAAHGAAPAEVALAWLMARPGVTAPIASATSVAQLDSLIRATTLALSGTDIAALDSASSY